MTQAHCRIVDVEPRKYGSGKPVPVLGLRESMRQVLDFKDNLRWLRDRYGIVSVAKSLGVSRPTVWRHLNGICTSPDAAILVSVNTWAETEKRLSEQESS